MIRTSRYMHSWVTRLLRPLLLPLLLLPAGSRMACLAGTSQLQVTMMMLMPGW